MREGAVALVTGAGSGIGEASARTLAIDGASVVVADVNGDAADRVATAIVDAGGVAIAMHADMANRDDIGRVVDGTVKQLGRLDVLVNNVAATSIAGVDALEVDQWQRTLDVSLTAYWFTTRCVLGHMRPRRRGSIVNIASVAGLTGDYALAAYCTAKAGVINLSRVTAIETAREGIRCNAVCPGTTLTAPIIAMQSVDPALLASVESAIPMGRFGQPQEIANVVAFLASGKASFVTGAAVVVDGGQLAHSGMPSLAAFGSDQA